GPRGRSGGGVRLARRPGAGGRRARHAGAVLAAAGGGVPGRRGADREGGAADAALLKVSRMNGRIPERDCHAARPASRTPELALAPVPSLLLPIGSPHAVFVSLFAATLSVVVVLALLTQSGGLLCSKSFGPIATSAA